MLALVDFTTQKAKEGLQVQMEEGDVLTICGLYSRRRNRGYSAIYASADGDRVKTHMPCRCVEDVEKVPAANLVTESRFFVCSSCRLLVE